MARETRYVLFAFGKGEIAGVRKIVPAVWKTRCNIFHQKEHLTRFALMRIIIAGEIARSVAEVTLDTECGNERPHYLVDVHVRGEHLQVPWRGQLLRTSRDGPLLGKQRERSKTRERQQTHFSAAASEPRRPQDPGSAY